MYTCVYVYTSMYLICISFIYIPDESVPLDCACFKALLRACPLHVAHRHSGRLDCACLRAFPPSGNGPMILLNCVHSFRPVLDEMKTTTTSAITPLPNFSHNPPSPNSTLAILVLAAWLASFQKIQIINRRSIKHQL